MAPDHLDADRRRADLIQPFVRPSMLRRSGAERNRNGALLRRSLKRPNPDARRTADEATRPPQHKIFPARSNDLPLSRERRTRFALYFDLPAARRLQRRVRQPRRIPASAPAPREFL